MAEMSEADKYKNEGNRLMQAGNLDGAIEQYSLGINVDEENHILYSNRSAAYAKKEMWNEALADGTKCVFLKPDWAKGYLRKGEALKQVGKIKEAQFCFQKGCSLDPKDQQMRQGLNACNMLLFQQQQEEDEKKRQAELEELRNPKPKPPPEPEKPKPPPKPTSEELRKDLATKSVKELRGYLSEKNIDASDCFEKEDLVNKIIRHGAYTRPEPVKEQPPPTSPKPAPASEQKTNTPVNDKPKETNSIPQIPKNDTKPEKSIPQIPVDEDKPKKTQTEEPAGAKGAFDDDINYYELLGISKTATPAEIKKAYYKQAQACHPDKTDDPRAEEQFKLISEAYGVLMDEEKRKTYDKYGRKRVQEMDGGMDPTMMFRMIFGGGAFDDTFGELSFIEQMSPEFASKWEGKPEDEVYAYMNAKQAERVKVLAAALIAKLAAREKGQDKDYESLVSDLQEKCDAPGGPALLAVIGYVYVSEAKKNAGRFFGIEGAVASVQETHHSVKQTFSFISSAVKVAQVQNDMEKGGDVNQEKAAEAILDTLWKLGKMEIEKVIRAVCTVIFKDKSCSKKKRATALKELGELYKRAAKKANKEKGLEKGTFF